jgi:2-iminobutanoate/2-iminopropanoate deaminase
MTTSTPGWVGQEQEGVMTDRSISTIFTEKAVRPVGPYPQAVRAGDFVFISGTVPVDPVTGKVVEREIKAQTTSVFDSIKAILDSIGATMDDLVKVTIHLQSAADWPAMNEVYHTYFGDYLPARMAFEGKPPLDYLIDVDAIAYLPR